MFGKNLSSNIESRYEKTIYSVNNPDEEVDEETSHQSIERYWDTQFRKQGLVNDAMIKPDFDIFSNFIAQNFVHLDNM